MIWSPDETAAIRSCNSRKEAKQRYRELFPDSPRLPSTVGRRFYDVRPDKREPIWSNEEKAPILAAETVEDALAEYQKLFPGSTRTIAAIKREWYELRPEKRGLVPTGRKKGGRNKTPLKGTAREKYGIPMSTKQDAKAYNHAVYICTKFDKPYTEALELEKAGAPKLSSALRRFFRILDRLANPKKTPPRKIRVAKVAKERPAQRPKLKPALQPMDAIEQKWKPPAPKPVREPVPAPVIIPPMPKCIRCGSLISPMDFLYTEKTGLCIPCWELQDVGTVA
jgi:hypothetical protein